MNTSLHETPIFGPAEYVAIAKRWWWLVALVTVLAASSGFWFSAQIPEQYEVQASLFVVPASAAPGDITAARLSTKTYSVLIKSQPVLERVVAELQLSDEVADLKNQISTSAPLDTQIINIRVTDADPERATDIANAAGNAFISWIGELQSAPLRQSTTDLPSTVAKFEGSIQKATDEITTIRRENPFPDAEETLRIQSLEALRRQYQSELDELRALQRQIQFTPQSQVLLSDPAVVPAGASLLRPIRDGLLAGALGLALTLVTVILLERISDRVRIPLEAQRKAGLPVLALIPRSRRRSRVEIVDAPHSATSEAIRSLRTTLKFATSDHNNDVIVVTSAEPSHVKSIIAANLAVAMADAGQRVILVDGNLRQPYQHELFATKNSFGLWHLLVQPIIQVEKGLSNGPIPGLQILLAGEHASNASELLSNERLEQIMAHLKQIADVVIIDAPPLDQVADAMLLAGVADSAFLVADTARSRGTALRTAAASIAQTKVHLLGLVLYGKKRTHGSYGYQAARNDQESSKSSDTERFVVVSSQGAE